MSVTFGEERGCPNAYTLKRPFIISAMSFGALGERAVRTFARGAKEAGILMNTGEGGYPKYHLAEGCDLIFQMGTAKFGVRDAEGSCRANAAVTPVWPPNADGRVAHQASIVCGQSSHPEAPRRGRGQDPGQKEEEGGRRQGAQERHVASLEPR